LAAADADRGGGSAREPTSVLDEPTTISTRQYQHAERWLMSEFKLPMLIVSHDREILDRVTERTLFCAATACTPSRRFSLARESCCADHAPRHARSSRRRDQAA